MERVYKIRKQLQGLQLVIKTPGVSMYMFHAKTNILLAIDWLDKLTTELNYDVINEAINVDGWKEKNSWATKTYIERIQFCRSKIDDLAKQLKELVLETVVNDSLPQEAPYSLMKARELTIESAFLIGREVGYLNSPNHG